MAKDMRNLVRSGYNKGKYDTVYARTSTSPEDFEKVLCNELISRIRPKSKILDLGCGVGLPYDRYFLKKGLSVTGVDISDKHIEQAKKKKSSLQNIL